MTTLRWHVVDLEYSAAVDDVVVVFYHLRLARIVGGNVDVWLLQKKTTQRSCYLNSETI